MGIIKADDIVGYRINKRLLCAQCAKDTQDVKQEDIITIDEVEKEGDLYFCDECGKQMN